MLFYLPTYVMLQARLKTDPGSENRLFTHNSLSMMLSYIYDAASVLLAQLASP